MPSLADPPPGYVVDQLAALVDALDADPGLGGVPPKDGSELLLATWNLREFGRFTPKWSSTGNDSPKRDLRSLLSIATILERFDVIALQELQSATAALREVLAWLNRDRPARWRIVVSDVVGGAKGGGERLGYLFDSSNFDLDGLVGELVISPEEIDGTPTDDHDGDDIVLRNQFARTPYAVSFRSTANTAMSFVLLTVHVDWGDDPRNRVLEANRIAQWVEDWAAQPNVWDPDIFVLGDFNADRVVDEHGVPIPAYRPFTDLLEIPTEMHGFPRTIFGGGIDKHYDMITWTKHAPGGFSLAYEDCGYFDILSSLLPSYGGTASSFSFRVSDHYPMWARFSSG